jgi:hypothetical protein
VSLCRHIGHPGHRFSLDSRTFGPAEALGKPSWIWRPTESTPDIPLIGNPFVKFSIGFLVLWKSGVSERPISSAEYRVHYVWKTSLGCKKALLESQVQYDGEAWGLSIRLDILTAVSDNWTPSNLQNAKLRLPTRCGIAPLAIREDCLGR